VWTKCLGGSKGEVAQSIQQTTDGGYIVAGYTSSNDGDVVGFHGDIDAWIVKLNNAGDVVWTKCLGGSKGEWAYSVQQTIDGGYIVAGYTQSNDGDAHCNHGNVDYWIVKLNNVGDTTWTKCLGGSLGEGLFQFSRRAMAGILSQVMRSRTMGMRTAIMEMRIFGL